MARVAKRKTRDGRVLPDNISERADGRFIYRYQVYGKPHYLYDRDLNNLKKKIAQLQIDVASGKNMDLAKMSLNEWYPQYIDIFKKNKVKETTLLNLKNYYKWYIEDSVIGRMPMKDMRRTHIVAHFKYLAEKRGLSTGTLRAVESMLHNCIQQVVYDGGLNINPASEIMRDVVAKSSVERDALSEEETKLLLDFLKIEGTWQNVYFPMIGVLLGTGMRFGECVGLTWDCVDLEKGVLYVTRTLNYRCKNSEKHEFFITTPKTTAGVRQIPLDDDMVRLFKMQKNYQKNMRIRSDIQIDGYVNFIFTARTGLPFTHEGFAASLRRIVKRANEWEAERAVKENRKAVVLPNVTAHMFRHTFCTSLILHKVPYETTQRIMGHTSIKVTIDIYSHVQKNIEARMRADIAGAVKIF